VSQVRVYTQPLIERRRHAKVFALEQVTAILHRMEASPMASTTYLATMEARKA
jgi:hypothetical protein